VTEFLSGGNEEASAAERILTTAGLAAANPPLAEEVTRKRSQASG
jgi:hypothetical protein